MSLTNGQRTSISKPEPLNAGMKILPHFTAREEQLLNVLFSAVNYSVF